MKRIIFELKISNRDSILAKEKLKYDSNYFDSKLYLKIKNKKIKIVDHSFCYGFGADMYYRINNKYDFSESHNFIKLLEDTCNAQTFDVYNEFAFVHGSNNKTLFLFKSTIMNINFYM